MSAVLSSAFGAGAQLFDNAGVVLSGGLIYTYQAGTTTLTPTWTTQNQTVANPNPIVLNSAGRVPQEVWTLNGTATKFVVCDSSNNVLGTYDYIPGINTTNLILSEWQPGITPTYVNPTTFTVPGNATTVYTPKRRVQFTVVGGTFYGFISTSTYTSLTTIVIVPDTTSMDSSLSSVNYGFLNSVNISIPNLFVVTSTSNVYTGATNDFTAGQILTGTPALSSSSTVVPNTSWVQSWITTIAGWIAAAGASGTPVAPFVPGNVYLQYAMVTSLINFQTYRHITATSNLTADPALDTANWVMLGQTTGSNLYLAANFGGL